MSSDKSADFAALKGNIKVIVEKIRIEGKGVIILTGPSSCGKGEIAKALCTFLNIPPKKHLSMGDILRDTINKARENSDFKCKLADKYIISSGISIFDETYNRPEVIKKAENHKEEVIEYLKLKTGFISQLDWLEFCVSRGLLIPDEWTEKLIDACYSENTELQQGLSILDGYPRTISAAESLISVLNRLQIPIIKVLHLSITKEQMKLRAYGRNRQDDTEESLERRYQFYVDRVQPCIDYLKSYLGASSVVLIDAHQPVYNSDGNIDVKKSIREVISSVIKALELPEFLVELTDKSES